MSKPQRRKLSLSGYDDILAEVDRLTSSPVRTIGHFDFAQILEHLATTMDVASGHIALPVKPGLGTRILARVLRQLILNFPMRPGFKLPPDSQSFLWPGDDIDTDQAVSHLRQSVARCRSLDPPPPHPIFGSMTAAEAEKIQCRHCELHLSFVVPDGN